MQDYKLISEVLPPAKNVGNNQLVLLEKAEKKWGEIKKLFGAYKNHTIGIEIEVENSPPAKPMLFWEAKQDGSLKVHGMEFVSVPVAGHNIDYALYEIRELLEHHPCLWSHRTSIHVHAGLQNMTMSELYALIASYAALEKLFFLQVDQVRRGNPYCYYLTDTNPNNLTLGKQSMKYCALNVGNSLAEYNTAEFRHMNGTSDFRLIRRWVQLIVKLLHYVKTKEAKTVIERVKSLNTCSEYAAFVNEVFNSSSKHFINIDFQKEMEEGVLWAKMYLLSKKGIA